MGLVNCYSWTLKQLWGLFYSELLPAVWSSAWDHKLVLSNFLASGYCLLFVLLTFWDEGVKKFFGGFVLASVWGVGLVCWLLYDWKDQLLFNKTIGEIKHISHVFPDLCKLDSRELLWENLFLQRYFMENQTQFYRTVPYVGHWKLKLCFFF